MNRYKIKVANRIVEIETVHVLPMALSRNYLTDGKAEIHICSTQNDIDREKVEFESHNGLSTSWDGNIEAIVVLEIIPEYGAFVMHGAAVAVNNNAYIFSGNSGIGKTTHILKWLRNLPDAFVVNGDKPFIISGDSPKVCGSPWAGKENMQTNSVVPLKAIAFLERAEDNSIRKVSFSEAFPLLYQQIYRSSNAEHVRKTLQLIKNLDGKISFYIFKINNFKDDCFEVAYNALVRGVE